MTLSMHTKIFIEKLFVSIPRNKANSRSKSEERKTKYTLISLVPFKKSHNVHSLLLRFEINSINRKFIKATKKEEKSNKSIKFK